MPGMSKSIGQKLLEYCEDRQKVSPLELTHFIMTELAGETIEMPPLVKTLSFGPYDFQIKLDPTCSRNEIHIESFGTTIKIQI